MALVSSSDEVARALLAYKEIGISQFLCLGWPDPEEMEIFGREVLPWVRMRERTEAAACP